MRDGQRVSYVGLPLNGSSVGDVGKVLSASGAACHVLWTSGARQGQVDLVIDDCLVPVRSTKTSTIADALDDSLHFESGLVMSAAAIYEAEGAAGVINAMNEAGHLAGLSSIADDALTLVATRIREDEGIAAHLSSLDADERDQVIALTSAVLLRDAFSIQEDD